MCLSISIRVLKGQERRLSFSTTRTLGSVGCNEVLAKIGSMGTSVTTSRLRVTEVVSTCLPGLSVTELFQTEALLVPSFVITLACSAPRGLPPRGHRHLTAVTSAAIASRCHSYLHSTPAARRMERRISISKAGFSLSCVKNASAGMSLIFSLSRPVAGSMNVNFPFFSCSTP